MITRITSIQELKQMFLEIFLNKTDKVNDVGNDSVLNGIAYGAAKVGQKCLVNQSIVEGHIFPDTAYGEYLDNLAIIRGVSPRFGAASSSTYVRVIGDEGTTYLKNVHTFISTTGITFSLEDDVVIGVNGYAYAKLRCNQSGLMTNVDPLSINKVNPIPTGHIACTNEYRAEGGRDFESDDLFRQRVKDSINQLSRTTISYLEQIFMKINNNVLRVYKGGIDVDGKLNLIVVSVNGQDFSEAEFNEILSNSEEFLSLSELLRTTNDYALKLNNVNWLMVDVDFRVDIDPAYDQDRVRREIQIQMSKLFDYRFWKYGNKIEWKNMLFAAKQVNGVRYVPDTHFYPQADVNVPKYQLPRIRSFVLRDLNGNIIEDNSGVLSQFFYPNSPDESYANTVLMNI
ncbi:MAG: baseplate J/gp47 family protein [Tissierellia bacterium]|nr:baseplate J/gp47 family protein [Tissierellia bacterium]